MKSTRFTITALLALMGLCTKAANLAERTLPATPDFGPGQLTAANFEAVPADFVVGDCYVIYNVGAQAYFSEGNLWGTQASVSKETPLLARFTLPEGKMLEDAALLFYDYPNTKNTWKLVFFDRDDQVYVDRGSQPDIYWQVTESSGDKAYRLQASALNPTYNPTAYPGYLGLDVTENASNTALHPFLSEGEGHYIDWQFFAVPEWTEYFRAMDVYDTAMKLKELILLAEAEGIDAGAAVAVYNDMSATVGQLQAAIDNLREAIAEAVGSGTPDHPRNATVLINNPNFDDASASGWDGTHPNMVGSGSHGAANVAEHYRVTFDTYQELVGLPAGVYALRAKTAFRGSWMDMLNGTPAAARLYAVVGDEDYEVPFNNIWSCLNTVPMEGDTYFGTYASEFVTNSWNAGQTLSTPFYSPNDPSSFRLYAEKGYYDTILFFEVTGDKARIGVRNPSMCTDGCDNWSVFDTFTLTYYGNEPGSYQKWLELALPPVQLTEDDVYSTVYWDAYQEALNHRVASKAEVLEAVELLRVRMAEMLANIRAWKQYVDEVASLAYILDKYDYYHINIHDGLKYANAAKDYLDNTYPQILGARVLTTEELSDEREKVNELTDNLRGEFAVVSTAVEGLEKTHNGEGIRYTIDGCKSQSVHRGLYIRDGKKVLK